MPEGAYHNFLYQVLQQDTENGAQWLRNGKLFVEFLDEILGGPYSDSELVHIWVKSGAESWVPKRHIRTYLAHMRDEFHELNTQLKNGRFIALDPQGNPMN